MLYQLNPSWGPEINYYINFILYAVSGKMSGADQLMQLYGDAIRRVAAKLHRLKPVDIKEVYRGLLVEPEGLGPGNAISKDPNNTFASFSEDKRVACWFADPNSAMSQFVRMTRPRVEGWVVNTTPKKNDILFHWTWGLHFPFGSREVGFDHFLRMHPEFQRLSSIEVTMQSQKEVILLPSNEVFKAVAFKDVGCPTTAELDSLFSLYDPRSRRNPISTILGENISSKRKEKGLSLGDLEIKTGISRRHLTEIEHGHAESLTVFMLQKLAYVFDCTPESLLSGLPSISLTRKLVACSQCISPTTGEEFKKLMGHLMEAHNLSFDDISHQLRIKRSTFGPYSHKSVLPKMLQSRITDWFNQNRETTPIGCSDCLIPHSGLELRALLKHLAQQHHLLDQIFADQLDIKLTTLRQYMHREEIPFSVTQKIARLFGRGIMLN